MRIENTQIRPLDTPYFEVDLLISRASDEKSEGTTKLTTLYSFQWCGQKVHYAQCAF